MPDPVFDPRLCANAIVHAIVKPSRDTWVGRSTMMMAVAQALAPRFADRQAGGMKGAQLGEPIGDKRGNLEEAVPGRAAIDGRWGAKVHPTRTEFVTSRQRDAAVLTLAGACAAIGLLPLLRRIGR